MTRQECIEQLQYAKFLILANDKDWLDARDIPMLDMAIEALEKQIPIKEQCTICPHCSNCNVDENGKLMEIKQQAIKALPSVEPEPLSDAYMKAVWTWLINYQTKAAELKGRYTPYEVLSWVVNDWRKDHEQHD